ncbi:hypothetical protein BDV30DRAFT_215733 [Aspergillus minisclerotigenes]|uniref:Uncharacterized protein n=1 Tax=Aspergillus minisclerotigenes TaxID=656917 RepID=A0A5N6IUT9_9EURO|nr:hypothetical protein BDV30DRAFT_215733 [Aspergillus minisclerotigenes]
MKLVFPTVFSAQTTLYSVTARKVGINHFSHSGIFCKCHQCFSSLLICKRSLYSMLVSLSFHVLGTTQYKKGLPY